MQREIETFRNLIANINFNGGQSVEEGQAKVKVIETQLDHQRSKIDEAKEGDDNLVAQNEQSLISRRRLVSRAASVGIALAGAAVFDQAFINPPQSNETHRSSSRSRVVQKTTPVASSAPLPKIVHEPAHVDRTHYQEGQQVKDIDISVNKNGLLVIPKSLIDQTVSGKYHDAVVTFSPKFEASGPTFHCMQEGTTEDPYATLTLGGVFGTVMKDPKHNGDYNLYLLPTTLDKSGKAVYTIQQDVQHQSPDKTIVNTQVYTGLEYTPYILTDEESGLEIISQVNPDDEPQVLPMLQAIKDYTRPFLKAKTGSEQLNPHVFFTPQRSITSIVYSSVNSPCPKFGIAYSRKDFAPMEHDNWQENSTFVHGLNMTADSISNAQTFEKSTVAMQHLGMVIEHLSRRYDEIASVSDSAEDSFKEQTRFTDIFDPTNDDFSETRYIDSLAEVDPRQIKFANWLRTMKHYGESFLQDGNENHIALTKGPAKKECQLLFTALHYVLESYMPDEDDRKALIHGYSALVAYGTMHPDEFRQTIKDIIIELEITPMKSGSQMSVKES